MTKRSLGCLLLLSATIAGACGGDAGVAPPPAAPTRVLARIEVTPPSDILVQGTTRHITVHAWDQFGERILDGAQDDLAYKAAFVSSAPDIARMTDYGLVTGLLPGVAQITASLTIGDSTLIGTMIAKVDPPAVNGIILTMNQNQNWSPYDISLKAPATVTWIVPNGMQAPTIWLNVWDPNAEKIQFVDGVATRTFATPGEYYYGTGGGLMWNEYGGRVQVF